MTESGMTGEQYTDEVQAAVERWLDYCSRMSAADFEAVAVGLRALAQGVLAGTEDLEATGWCDSLADLMETMRRVRVAMDEENRNG